MLRSMSRLLAECDLRVLLVVDSLLNRFGSVSLHSMRMDYLRPYSLAHAVQSFTVLSEEPEPQFGYEDSPPNPGGGCSL